jgi:hypothetical protein
MNDKGIKCWNADACPWSTVTITVTADINCSGYDAGDPEVDCSYSTTESITGSGIETFTFSREYPSINDFIQSVNTFALAAGNVATGDGSPVPPFFRSVYTLLCGENGVGNADFEDTTRTMDIHRTVTYARVGPDPFGDCDPLPADIDTTDPYVLGCGLGILQISDALEITPAVYAYSPGGTYTYDTNVTTPVFITVENFKSGGNVDFGSGYTAHATNPNTLYWTSWSALYTFTFTTS